MPMLLHAGRWVQSLLQSADLSHPLSLAYLNSAVSILSKLIKCTCKITPYYFS